MYGALCVVGAIFHRGKTGQGQHIDVAQSEAITTFLPEVIMEYSMNGRIRPRMGNRDDIMAPHSCFPCKGRDKWVAIAVGTDEEWKAMCKVMGNPEWSKDEKFADQFSRWENQDELNKLVGNWTKDFTHYEVMKMLQKAGVAAGVSMSTKEMYNDPHVKARGALIEKDHLEGGKVLTWRAPWASALTAENPPAPLFGQHNSYVYQDLLGMSEAEMAKLIEQKVIY
jgi:benzylsuccinate CoA-transferase BbsF subunit